MPDWRNLTGRDLDRYIAEKIGYHGERERDGQWRLVDKDGNWASTTVNASPSEDSAFFWESPGWYADTDTALTLPLNGAHFELAVFQPSKPDGKSYYICDIKDSVRDISIRETDSGDTLAAIICYTWLAYMEYIEEKGQWANY